MSNWEEYRDDAVKETPVRGFLRRPAQAGGDSLILTHGAGANCNAPVLVAIADAFCGSGLTVLRCDLPFRQLRPSGPPPRGSAERDQAGTCGSGCVRAGTNFGSRVSRRSFVRRKAVIYASGGSTPAGRCPPAAVLPIASAGTASRVAHRALPSPSHPGAIRERCAGWLCFYRGVVSGFEGYPRNHRTAYRPQRRPRIAQQTKP